MPALLIIALFLNLQVSGESLSRYLVQRIEHQLVQEYGKDTYRFDVSLRYLPDSFRDVTPAQITNIKLSRPGLPSGYAMAEVTFTSHGQAGQGQVQFFVDVWEQLPVPRERIMPNKPLDTLQFKTSWIKMTRLQGNYLKEINSIEGKVSERLLSAGKPVPVSSIHNPPVINFGDNITLEYHDKGIFLRLLCVARQPGSPGERIRVYCKETRKTYIATVINASKVKWEKTL